MAFWEDEVLELINLAFKCRSQKWHHSQMFFPREDEFSNAINNDPKCVMEDFL